MILPVRLLGARSAALPGKPHRRRLRFETLEDRRVLAAFPTLTGPPYEGTEILLNQDGDATIEGEIAVADETQEYWFVSDNNSAFISSNGTTDTVIAYYEQAGGPTQIAASDENMLVSTSYQTPAAISVGKSGTSTGDYELFVSTSSFQVEEIDIRSSINYGVAEADLYDSYDFNWHKFTPGSSGTWAIRIDTDGRFDATIAVFDEYGNRLLSDSEDDPNLPQNDASASEIETYTLSVRSFDTDDELYVRVGSAETSGEYIGDDYRLIVQGPLEFDEYNPSISQAVDLFPSATMAFGDSMESGTASQASTRFYRLPSDVPGFVEIDLSSSDVALALYFDAGPPDLVEYPYSYSYGPYLEEQLPGDGTPVAIGVIGSGAFDLYGYLYPPSAESITIRDDLTATEITLPGQADKWLELRAPVAGQYVVSRSFNRNVSVYDANGERLVGPSGSVAVELDRRETAYVRVEADPLNSSVITVDALGAAVVIDTLTAPFVILDPFISQFTMAVNWDSLNGTEDALQVFLERVEEGGSITEEYSFIDAYDLTSGSGPGEIVPIAADNFVYADDVPGETVYRIRLRAFDGDGSPSIAGLEIGSLGMTETATVIRGDYNQDGAVDAADYTLWRNALDGAYDQRIDGDGDRSIGVGDYLVWREGYGSASTVAFWDFEGLEDGGFPAGWESSGDLFLGEWGAASAMLGGSGTVMRMFHDAATPAASLNATGLSPLAFSTLDIKSATVAGKPPQKKSVASPQQSLDLLYESIGRSDGLLWDREISRAASVGSGATDTLETDDGFAAWDSDHSLAWASRGLKRVFKPRVDST